MSVNQNVKNNKGKKHVPPPSNGIFESITAPFEQLDQRTKLIIKIVFGCFLVAWAVGVVVLVFHNLSNPDGPYIFDAMKAPYTLESRWQPVLPNPDTNVMPAVVGDFSLDLVHSRVAAKGTSLNSVLNTQPGACLYSAVERNDLSNCTGFNADYAATGDFTLPSGQVVNVVMALFPRHDDAISVMKAMLAEQRTNGDVGNYVIGVTLVSYFNSASNGMYHFFWSNGNWVSIASSISVKELGQLITDFPY